MGSGICLIWMSKKICLDSGLIFEICKIPWPPNTTLETVQSSIGSMLQLEFLWVMGHPWWIHPCLERIISATHMGTSDWNDLGIRINPQKNGAKMGQATSTTGVTVTDIQWQDGLRSLVDSYRHFGKKIWLTEHRGRSGHGMHICLGRSYAAIFVEEFWVFSW